MQTIVFDLDGTLVDSAGDLQSACNRVLADLGKPPLDRETVIRFIGRGVEVLVRRVLSHSGLEPAEAEFRPLMDNFHRYYSEELMVQTRLFPGAAELIRDAAARGLRLGICTNKPEAPAREICVALGLADHLGAVVGGDTLALRKPNAEPLLHTIQLLGGDPASTLYVGDSETDYLTSRAAGIPFVYFEAGYQRDPIADFAPDYRVAAIADVAEILAGN